MNECERYETMLSAYLDGELPEAEEAELKAHLANCPECAAMYEAFSAVGEAVRTQDVPDTLHSRIMETVRAAEKASRTQRAIIRLRPIFAAAACLIVLVGTVFALKNTTGFGRKAMRSADAAAPMATEESAMLMTGGATVADVRLMRETVGPEMGVKASGGVRTKADAEAMIEAGASRIGTSSSKKIIEG